jgi:hypothetical protein
LGSLSLSLFFGGCNQSSNQVEPEIPAATLLQVDGKTVRLTPGDYAQASARERAAYVEQHLDVIGQAVLLNAPDENFRQALYAGINKKFDGEANVLLKDLLASSPAIADKLEQAAARNGSGKVSTALAAFRGLNNNNAYPQLYIPFYDELKEDGILGKNAPIVVLYDGKDHLTYPGFTLDATNGLIKNGLTVDEAMARQNEVWVISINERVDTDGKLIAAMENMREYSPTNRVETGPYRLIRMRISCHGRHRGGQPGPSHGRKGGPLPGRLRPGHRRLFGGTGRHPNRPDV